MTDSFGDNQSPVGMGLHPNRMPFQAVPTLRDGDSLSLSELALVAVHEAGHALFALAVGVAVARVDIVPQAGQLGVVAYGRPPLPNEACCEPGSFWLDTCIRLALSGDRAVRIFRPNRETATGGRHSDYDEAMALIDAAYPSAEVELAMDSHAAAVDLFFGSEEIRHELSVVVAELLEKKRLSGDQLRQLLNRRMCGVKSPDGAYRCRLDPHPFGDHIASLPRPRPGFGFDHVSWAGFDFPDHVSVSCHTARWKRVVRVVDPSRVPPAKRKPDWRDLGEIRARALDPQTSTRTRQAANRQILALLADRVRDSFSPLPTPAGTDAHAATLTEKHEQDCASQLVIDPDGSAWCSDCALEFVPPPGKRPRRLYLVKWGFLARLLADNGTWNELPHWVEKADLAFQSAEEARTYLRLLRDVEDPDHGYFVQRIEPVPARRTKAGPTTGGSTSCPSSDP